MNKDLFIKIGRWLAVIPVAIIGFVLGGIVSNIFFVIQGWFIGISPDSGFGKINFWIISSAISAGASVYFGSKIAPSHRKIVSMILAALIVGISVLSIMGAVNSGDDVVWSILASIAAIFAAGFVVYNFFEQGDDFSISD